MDALTLMQVFPETCHWPCKIVVIGGVIRDLAIVLVAFYSIRFLKAKSQ